MWSFGLKGNSSTESLSFWQQARRFADASHNAPVQARPLILYYCFLNAAKALLTCKNFDHGKHHGVSGTRPEDARASLVNEVVNFKSGGILPALCRYFGESATEEQYSLSDLFWNVPFIHRAYRLTYTSKAELFIPLEGACYMRKVNSSEAWFQA
ncbi:YaaC family protein [Rhodobacteraceae bacterium PD-2]|uniref:HEPN domain-containing protein n=1 Tax=Ponticoccus alexandrii TaxID=1943633 RepID=A0ABX7FA44_9RHOB|nr:hypothetical protein GQA70_12905 [Ponticoccus alexandrii]